MSFFADLIEDVARYAGIARDTRDCPLDVLIRKRDMAVEEVASLNAFIARAGREIERRNAESEA